MKQTKNKNLISNKQIAGKDVIRYLLIIYWSIFWLMNSIDKIIGGSHFLFVGKDRFATIERFFASIGLPDPLFANIALIITSGLEIFAFLFFSGALYYLKKKDTETAKSWFFTGIVITLTIFTFFSIGDQIFGDHGELLEHSIYWFIALLSWIIFIHIEKIRFFDDFSVDRKQIFQLIIIVTLIISITAYSIFHHNKTSFVERTQAVNAVKIDSNKYKISFPFLAGSTAFENSLAKFIKENPSLKIKYIYTVPQSMRLGKSDGLIIYIQTEKK